MDRKRRNMVWTSVAAAVTVALVGGWAGTLLVPERYPAVAGYKVPGLVEAPVDLAALQRSWPAGFSQPGEDVRLMGYMTRIEQGAVTPPPVDAAAVAAKPMPEVDLGTRLAKADVERGRGTARVCSPCHSFEANGPDRIGPNLWGLVGRPIAGHAGFSYSQAMEAQAGNWSYERLDKFLSGPARDVPGTKMAFGGVRNGADRANLLAFLATLNTAPPPFPAPAPMTADRETASR